MRNDNPLRVPSDHTFDYCSYRPAMTPERQLHVDRSLSVRIGGAGEAQQKPIGSAVRPFQLEVLDQVGEH